MLVRCVLICGAHRPRQSHAASPDSGARHALSKFANIAWRYMNNACCNLGQTCWAFEPRTDCAVMVANPLRTSWASSPGRHSWLHTAALQTVPSLGKLALHCVDVLVDLASDIVVNWDSVFFSACDVAPRSMATLFLETYLL